jgi:hypothetical protein
MKTFQIELLVPEAEKLLDELVNLKLIKLQEMPEPKLAFQQLLTKIREKNAENLTLNEISQEVESVRAKRYDK